MPDAFSVLDISARTGEGLDALRERISAPYLQAASSADATLVSNLRHYEALTRAAEELARVRCGIDAGTTPDLLADDLRAAIYSLNSIFGEVTSEDILQSIFSRFCIGK